MYPVDFKKGEKEIINETLSYQYWMILQKDDPLYYYHWSRLKYFDPRFKDRLIKLDTFSSNLIRLELNENGFLSPLQKKIDREKRVQLSRLSYSSTNLRKSEGSVLCLTKGNCKIRGANSTGNVDPIPRSIDPCFPLRRTPIVVPNLAIIDRRSIGLRHTPAPRSRY